MIDLTPNKHFPITEGIGYIVIGNSIYLSISRTKPYTRTKIGLIIGDVIYIRNNPAGRVEDILIKKGATLIPEHLSYLID